MITLLDRISPDYLDMQRELHLRPNGYGAKGKKWADTVIALAKRYAASSVLDYGCGTGSLAVKLREMKKIRFRIAEYDPAIKGKDGMPLFADLVVITDVLEHIERDRLDAVLEHLRILARKAVFFVIALDPANKILLDGRNAHLILETPEWWEARIVKAGFTLEPLNKVPLPAHYSPAKRSKRWIGIGVPAC